MLIWWNLPASDFGKLCASILESQAKHFSEEEKVFARNEFQQAILETQALLKGLSSSKGGKNSKYLRDQSLAIFRNRSVQMCAVLFAHHRKTRKYKQFQSYSQVQDAVSRVSELSGQKEKINIVDVKKTDGLTRRTYAFGPIRYSQQLILVWILSTLIKPFKNDYSLSGMGGIHASAKQIAKHIAEGNRFWAVADIKTAFPSVRRYHLENLVGINQKLVRYIAFPCLPIDTNKDITNASTGFPHRGLPQGGAHSSFILSCLIDGYLAEISDGIVKLAYADNLAMGAHTVKDALRALRDLQSVLATKLGGGVTLHEKEVRDGFYHGGSGKTIKGIYYGNAINFVGYRISVDQRTGAKRIRPNEACFVKLFHKIETEFQYWEDASVFDAENNATQYLKTWSTYFTAWQPNEYAENNFICRFFLERQTYMSATSGKNY